MRKKIIDHVINKIGDVELTGDPKNRVPNMASFAFKGINGKTLVKYLSSYKIAISSGSACSSAKTKPSRILDALGFEDDFIAGSVRISLGKYNKKSEVNYLLKILTQVVSDHRSGKSDSVLNLAYISQTDFEKELTNKSDLQILDVRLV